MTSSTQTAQQAAQTVELGFRAFATLLRQGAEGGFEDQVREIDGRWERVLRPTDHVMGDLAGYETHSEVGIVSLLPPAEESVQQTGEPGFELRASRATYRFALACWALDRVLHEEERREYWLRIARHFAGHFRDARELVFVAGRLVNKTFSHRSFLFQWLMETSEAAIRRGATPLVLRGFVSCAETKMPSEWTGEPLLQPELWLESQYDGLIGALSEAPELYPDGQLDDSRRSVLQRALGLARQQAAEQRQVSIRRADLDGSRIGEFVNTARAEFLRLPRLMDLLSWAAQDDLAAGPTPHSVRVEVDLEKESFLPVRPPGWARLYGEHIAEEAAEVEDSLVRSDLELGAIMIERSDVLLGIQVAVEELSRADLRPSCILAPSLPDLASVVVDRPAALRRARQELVDSGLSAVWAERFEGRVGGIAYFRLRGLSHVIVADAGAAIERYPAVQEEDVHVSVVGTAREEALRMARQSHPEGSVEARAGQILDTVSASLVAPTRGAVVRIDAVRQVMVLA